MIIAFTSLRAYYSGMGIRITLGEPLWREVGATEFEWEVGPEGLTWEEVLFRLEKQAIKKARFANQAVFPRPGDPNSEAGLLVILNDRMVPPGQVGQLRVRNGDRLSLQIALSGG